MGLRPTQEAIVYKPKQVAIVYKPTHVAMVYKPKQVGMVYKPSHVATVNKPTKVPYYPCTSHIFIPRITSVKKGMRIIKRYMYQTFFFFTSMLQVRGRGEGLKEARPSEGSCNNKAKTLLDKHSFRKLIKYISKC